MKICLMMLGLFECRLIMICKCYVDVRTLLKRWNVLFFRHFRTVCRHRHSIYTSWSNGTQKVITSLGKSLFFSFWLKPADSSFSCWHFLVSLYYAYTMTKVIITNYLNTYHLLVCKKKYVCVILIQTRKDILLLVVLTTDWLVFSFNFLITKMTFFCQNIFFTWNWCIYFCFAKFLF